MDATTIQVTPETLETLRTIRDRLGFRSYEAVIKYMLKMEMAREINLGKNVPPLTGYTRYENYWIADLPGMIDGVTVNFPPGCAGLVELAFGVGDNQILPHEGYIAWDNVNKTFPIRYPVKMKEKVWAEILNHDSANSHNIGLTFTYRSALYVP